MRPPGPAISRIPRSRTKRPRSRTWQRKLAPIAAPRSENAGTPSTHRTTQGEAARGSACSQGGHRAADGRSRAGEGSHRSRAQGKDRRGDGHQEEDHGSGGAKARRVVHPAPSRDDSEFQPLRGVHRRQSAMAQHGVAAPARRGAAVGAAQRCGNGSRLHRRSARQRQGQAGAGARAARRGRSGRRGQAGARRMAIGRIVGAPGDRRARDVPRPSHSR